MEMAQTMLNESKLNDKFWRHTIHIAIHILNRGLLRNKNDKTPYDLWTRRATSVQHFRIFGSKCYIKREDKKIGKLDSQLDEGIFVGYSSKWKAYKRCNFRLNKVIVYEYVAPFFHSEYSYYDNYSLTKLSDE